MRRKVFSRQFLYSDIAILCYLALFKLILHLLFIENYGYFRDEFYYIACSDHLALGYVDHPPLSIIVLWISRGILGDSLLAIRFFPALSGALVVLLTGLMVRKLGGSRFSQFLAAIAVIAAPAYLSRNSFFSMNSFDLLFWVLAAYIIIRLVIDENPRLWVLLGLVIGLGLLNKISVLWFGFGLVVGILLTQYRKALRTRWPWFAGIIAFLLFLPHILWQIKYDWPTLEFIQRATSEKMATISPLQFIVEQILSLNPVSLPIWLIGLVYCFVSKDGKRFRILGFIYLVVFLLLIISKRSRPGYLDPAYPMLFAFGALVIEKFIRGQNWNWLKLVFGFALIVSGIIMAPLGMPILPVKEYIKYTRTIGVGPSTHERKEVDKLPQHYADMHGWENMVATIARVYNRLSMENQSKCVIYANNYGEAGAVDFLGWKYNLPKAICGHNNYWLWGPGEATGEVVIRLGGPSIESLRQDYREVELAEVFRCEYCMPYENNMPIYICKGLYAPLKDVWPTVKHYD